MDAYAYSTLSIYLTFSFPNGIQTKTSALPTALLPIDQEMRFMLKLLLEKYILLSGQVCPAK